MRPRGAERDDAWIRWVSASAVVVALAPLAAALGKVVAQDPAWKPVGDLAIMELVTRGVGNQPVLVGAYSRFGWDHPGPALYYLFAGPYRLSGGASAALPFVAVLINTASVLGVAAVARRRCGATGMLWALATTGVLLWSLGERLLDPWNPVISVLPFSCSVLLAWSFACGDRWCLPLAAAVGSFAVQAHLGFLLPVVAVLGVAVGLRLLTGVAARRAGVEPPSGRWRGPLVVTVLSLAVIWAPPLVDQVLHRPGNLSEIAAYGVRARPAWTLAQAAEVAVVRFGALPSTVLGIDARSDPHLVEHRTLVPGVVTLLALAGGTGVSVWQRHRGRVALGLLAAVLAVVSVLTAARVEKRFAEFLLEWMAVVGLVTWMLVGWTCLSLVRQGRRNRRWLEGTLLVAAVVTSVAGTTTVLAGRSLQSRTSAAMAHLGEAVRRELHEEGSQQAVLTFGPSAPGRPSSVGWGSGLVLDLAKAGIDVAVDDRWAHQFDPVRTSSPRSPSLPTLTVVTDPDFRPESGARSLASATVSSAVVRVYWSEPSPRP